MGSGAPLEIAIFAMVLVQIVAPQSKRGGREWAEIALFFPEAKGLSLADLYDAMDALHASYPSVEERLKAVLDARGIVPTEFAEDSTTTSCRIRYDDRERAEIERERVARGEVVRAAVVNDPPIRMRGQAKDKRFDLPQVKIEAVVGDHQLIVIVAILDANVLFSARLRDLMVQLELAGLFQARWTERILDECFDAMQPRLPDVQGEGPQDRSQERDHERSIAR